MLLLVLWGFWESHWAICCLINCSKQKKNHRKGDPIANDSAMVGQFDYNC
jgi:hypothetical protein